MVKIDIEGAEMELLETVEWPQHVRYLAFVSDSASRETICLPAAACCDLQRRESQWLTRSLLWFGHRSTPLVPAAATLDARGLSRRDVRLNARRSASLQ